MCNRVTSSCSGDGVVDDEVQRSFEEILTHVDLVVRGANVVLKELGAGTQQPNSVQWAILQNGNEIQFQYVQYQK